MNLSPYRRWLGASVVLTLCATGSTALTRQSGAPRVFDRVLLLESTSEPEVCVYHFQVQLPKAVCFKK